MLTPLLMLLMLDADVADTMLRLFFSCRRMFSILPCHLLRYTPRYQDCHTAAEYIYVIPYASEMFTYEMF